MKTELKEGACLHMLTGGMAIAHGIIEQVFADVANVDCVITHGYDGRHSPKSLHYHGRALDYRSKHIPEREVKDRVLQEIRRRLGVVVDENGKRITGHYDVLLEGLYTPQEHYHVEEDPVFYP